MHGRTVNLAAALSQVSGGSKRVGLLDLDIFGPSVPKLMGLDSAGEPELTKGRAMPQDTRESTTDRQSST